MKKTKTIKTDFLKTVKDTVKRYDMLASGDKVLVAVSGGPDSVCLLDSLFSMRKKYGINLVVANMDHGIRGAESRRDSDFVKKFSKKMGIDCICRRLALSKRKKSKLSMEEVARKERYDFLCDAAGKTGCNIIATGHILDDQAETVLMRILMGTSLKGLAGIPPVRHSGDIRVIRPMIRNSKKDVLEYLQASGLEYCTDHTNDDKKYFRNRVRKDILPFLAKFNPKILRSLVNLADTSREDLEFIESVKGRVPVTDVTSAGIKDLILQPKSVRKDIFKEMFINAGGNVKKLTYRHWIDIDQFVKTADKGKSLDLPGKVRVKKTGRDIVFTR